ncbi:5-oxoprolinase [Pseudozyma hubeiensis SY62]|uniref:5-oxoprolinase n=1 Tax=Pseudozyma hubeiensis (strain SY62) TaxID=1305764 RepID=R9NYZ8_PSEHS|nr:5-oxoprolinase [Pseudozyma hubeiensis SY62]GAC94068.1 5-oxoprolinase [Pseudozyma hubeiensis SY62]
MSSSLLAEKRCLLLKLANETRPKQFFELICALAPVSCARMTTDSYMTFRDRRQLEVTPPNDISSSCSETRLPMLINSEGCSSGIQLVPFVRQPRRWERHLCDAA